MLESINSDLSARSSDGIELSVVISIAKEWKKLIKCKYKPISSARWTFLINEEYIGILPNWYKSWTS